VGVGLKVGPNWQVGAQEGYHAAEELARRQAITQQKEAARPTPRPAAGSRRPWRRVTPDRASP